MGDALPGVFREANVSCGTLEPILIPLLLGFKAILPWVRHSTTEPSVLPMTQQHCYCWSKTSLMRDRPEERPPVFWDHLFTNLPFLLPCCLPCDQRQPLFGDLLCLFKILFVFNDGLRKGVEIICCSVVAFSWCQWHPLHARGPVCGWQGDEGGFGLLLCVMIEMEHALHECMDLCAFTAQACRACH